MKIQLSRINTLLITKATNFFNTFHTIQSEKVNNQNDLFRNERFGFRIRFKWQIICTFNKQISNQL